MYYSSFIAKTETANEDMEYIVNTKLSGFSGPLQLRRDSTGLAQENTTSHGDIELPLFSSLKNPEAIIRKLMPRYGLDMKLFGYGFKVKDGKVFAVCDSYEKFGFCC